MTELDVPLSKDRLSARVADRLQEFITGNNLEPGSRLPSERSLAESLGVSRIVIREGMKMLEERGLVHVRTGLGSYVAHIQPESVAESMGLLFKQEHSPYSYLEEIRDIVEVKMAALAAERRTENDLVNLEESIQRMYALKGNLDEFVQADLDFHIAVAEATQNPLFVVLIKTLNPLMLDLRRAADHIPGAIEGALYYHQRIYEAIKNSDGAAGDEMADHLDGAKENVKKYLASKENEIV